MCLSIRKRCSRPTVHLVMVHCILQRERTLLYRLSAYKSCCYAITEINRIKNEAEERMDPYTYWSSFVFFLRV